MIITERVCHVHILHIHELPKLSANTNVPELSAKFESMIMVGSCTSTYSSVLKSFYNHPVLCLSLKHQERVITLVTQSSQQSK